MKPTRRKKIGPLLIEEYFWCGQHIVYVNNQLQKRTFTEICKEAKNFHNS